MENKIKAYCAYSDWAEGVVLAYAENASKARALVYAAGTYELQDVSFTDIKIKREPGADNYKNYNDSPRVVPFNKGDYDLFRDTLGWFEINEPRCFCCGNSSYGQEKYEVCDGCSQCRECGCQCDSKESIQKHALG